MNAGTTQAFVSLFLGYLVGISLAQGFSKPEISQEMESMTTITVSQLNDSGEAQLGQRIRIVGTLQNIGKNYFTDLKVVLKDPDGTDAAFVYVRAPWLLEIPPRPPGRPSTKRPDTLSKYLGKTVELYGVFKKGTLKNLGEVRFIEVEAARIIETAD